LAAFKTVAPLQSLQTMGSVKATVCSWHS